MKFFKGTLLSCVNGQHISPGLVTTDIRKAYNWMKRLCSDAACLIEIEYNPDCLLKEAELTRFLPESRSKQSYWVDTSHTCANIKTITRVRVLNQQELNTLIAC